MNINERQSVMAFLFTCKELEKTGFGRQFNVASCKSYRLQPNTLHSTKVKRLDNDQLRSFLLSFRKLVLNNEAGNFNRVLNILSRHGNQEDQYKIRSIKKEIKSVETSVAGVHFGIGTGLKPVKPKEAFEALTNGVLFHNDPKREKELNFFSQAGAFALLAVIHYVVFVYKQALRVSGAVILRGIA